MFSLIVPFGIGMELESFENLSRCNFLIISAPSEECRAILNFEAL